MPVIMQGWFGSGGILAQALAVLAVWPPALGLVKPDLAAAAFRLAGRRAPPPHDPSPAIEAQLQAAVADRDRAQALLNELSQSLERRVEERTADLRAAKAALEQALAERQAAAESLARSNHDLTDFAQIASHDLQEPLRKIRACGLSLAEDHRHRLDQDGAGLILTMTDAAGRMQSLIDNVLALARVAAPAPQSELAALDQVIAQVIDDLSQRIRQAGAQVVAGPMPLVVADETRMRQLFHNLLGNAIKYRSPDRDLKVRIGAQVADGRARLFVEDNGIGFDPVYSKAIFEPFRRLHSRSHYEGSGIGLAICARIVAHHRGTIAAEGRPGAGTRFIVNLQAGPAPLRHAPAAS